MAQSEPNGNWIYLCDDIVVEPHAHRLARDGRDVLVEPKAYAVLVALLDHTGEVVSKDALLDAAWGHRHVTPGVLNRAISQLRHALGDSAEHPHYIATVHSLGYRFIGDLQCSPPPENGSPELPPQAPPPCVPTQVPATNKPAEVAQPPYRRRFTDGDQFLNCIDLQPCLKQLANWAALLPSGHTQRSAILEVLGLEYARLRASGMATPALAYHEAILAMLKGDRHAALSALSQAIDEGFRDELALRRDLAWRALTDDADFHHQQKRLDALLAAERAPHEPLAAR